MNMATKIVVVGYLTVSKLQPYLEGIRVPRRQIFDMITLYQLIPIVINVTTLIILIPSSQMVFKSATLAPLSSFLVVIPRSPASIPYYKNIYLRLN